MKILVFCIFGLLLNLSCKKEEVLPFGRYGGEQFLMEAKNDGLYFTWGCASGESKVIPKIIKNSFTVKGTYTRGMGVIPADPALWPKPQNTIFYGTISGKTITIKPKLMDANQDLGTFKATFGQRENIFFCL